MALIDVARGWIGREFDITEFEILEAEVLAFARACGETDPRFSDPSHPDFQAPPSYTSRFMGRRLLPSEITGHLGRGFDAGKTVEVHAPVRPGDRLTGRSTIHDVFEKTGRSGSMTFIVHRMEYHNQRGEKVSTVDWRMVQRGKPA
ncbi:MAG: MaoC family dehydratase N-terminal domain-containing protein [Myxococcota bacterium]